VVEIQNRPVEDGHYDSNVANLAPVRHSTRTGQASARSGGLPVVYHLQCESMDCGEARFTALGSRPAIRKTPALIPKPPARGVPGKRILLTPTDRLIKR
jgi:hypothetical protein